MWLRITVLAFVLLLPLLVVAAMFGEDITGWLSSGSAPAESSDKIQYDGKGVDGTMGKKTDK